LYFTGVADLKHFCEEIIVQKIIVYDFYYVLFETVGNKIAVMAMIRIFLQIFF